MNTIFTEHATTRIRQRGLREDDIDVIVDAGTSLDGESVLLLDQDVEREVRRRKREISILERLRGCRVILAADNKVVTVYRMHPKTAKRILRGTKRRPQPLNPANPAAPAPSPKGRSESVC